MSEEVTKGSSGLNVLLQLEAMARDAKTVKELQFLIVNETRKLVSFKQACLCLLSDKKTYRVEAASSIAVLDRNAPFIRWLERFIKQESGKGLLKNIYQIDESGCPDEFREGWRSFSMPFVVWCPLRRNDGVPVGGLWLGRDTPWQANELTILKRIASTYTHALCALGVRPHEKPEFHGKIYSFLALAILTVVMISPVHLSALAPVEVVARDPAIVSAPVNGVISEIFVEPNTQVSKGQKIFRFDDTTLRNRLEIALKTRDVSAAEYRKATQQAFNDPQSKARVAYLKSQVELSEAEVNYARELLEQVDVFALRDGVLLYSEKDEWIGKPVQVGERIMEVANPDVIELRIELAVEDAIVLEESANVDIFLDVNPLESIPAKITHTSYRAEITPANALAFLITADFIERPDNLRIGLRGTAKIHGEQVSMFFYLFRRPISSLRQMVGL